MGICNKVEFVSMPVGGSHVVWFKNSRTFLMLDEPAFTTLQMKADGKTTKSILASLNPMIHFVLYFKHSPLSPCSQRTSR
jgi:hypothetical protein